MGLENGKVLLERNFEKWQKMFDEEAFNLKKIFGDIALQIEHIGSTSIPGLSAKPIVDIAVAVNNLDEIKKITEELEKAYTVKISYEQDEILLIKEDDFVTYFLIHIMDINKDRYKNAIIFRDYLKSNNDLIKEYENLKLELAKKYPFDRKMYTQSKNTFIQSVLEKAKNK